MGLIGGKLGTFLLRKFSPKGHSLLEGDGYQDRSKLEALLGPEIWAKIQGKTIIDFGCGNGTESIEMAKKGAKKVIGLEIQQDRLEVARNKSKSNNLDNICTFGETTDEKADIIIALDSFEHFDEPEMILDLMYDLLNPGGKVISSWGPPWYHPLGGHAYSPFVWSHLLLTEQCLVKWKSEVSGLKLEKFSDWPGGLNQMSISKFKQLAHTSKFSQTHIKPIPIKKLQLLSNPLTKEFTTAVVRIELEKSADL